MLSQARRDTGLGKPKPTSWTWQEMQRATTNLLQKYINIKRKARKNTNLLLNWEGGPGGKWLYVLRLVPKTLGKVCSKERLNPQRKQIRLWNTKTKQISSPCCVTRCSHKCWGSWLMSFWGYLIIFQRSWQPGEVSKDRRKANVMPVFRKG